MTSDKLANAELEGLITWLRSRREEILAKWRRSVRGDEEEQTAQTLSRHQLNDHIPQVLEAFERELSQFSNDNNVESVRETEKHGLHRWQQGYALQELTKEWGHLHLCLQDELENYAAEHPNASHAIMSKARRILAQLCIQGVSSSTQQYFELHQREMQGQVKDLEAAIEQINTLELKRGEAWREAAHDLRGSVGLVNSAAMLVDLRSTLSPSQRPVFEVLLSNISTLRQMLNDILDLSRLEAGQDHREVSELEIGELLRGIARTYEPKAEEKGLTLVVGGTEKFSVQGDRIKISRIAHNLLNNALKYTEEGRVVLHWGPVDDDPAHAFWFFSITDTGPGILAGPGAPLNRELKRATEIVHDTDGSVPKPPHPILTPHQRGGEGIGLSIVKRLSDLLDGNLELSSNEPQGSIFKVTLPCKYD